MEKKKLKLNSIKVESFVTKLDDSEKITVNGAAGSGWFVCSLYLSGCIASLNCPTFTCNPPVQSLVIHDCDQAPELSKQNSGFCLNSYDPNGCIKVQRQNVGVGD